MVFSSLEFIYLFLPPVLGIFLLLRWLRMENAIIWWLIAASLAFYCWWSPLHLLLLLGSVGANYALHRVLIRRRSRALLVVGIVGNLALLAWFKYADFLIGNIAAAFGGSHEALGVVLPLAISFFTFQQISFLLDTWRGQLEECDFKRYVLFVTFFPQLIAGPIVLQKDTIPQFQLSNFVSRTGLNLLVGAALFCIGLFKKIVLADGIAPFANAAFAAADGGQTLAMDAAWIGALAYTFQIYFDFSGYCDMALGLARMFGIKLPINFNSPYKALSISDFWRRWHITLSRFLRDYLYIALGGNRSGILGRHGNLLATMLLGGLWHGAGWNFVIWGGLHGSYLVINHFWRDLKGRYQLLAIVPTPIAMIGSWFLTMLAVVIAWVFFRAETFGGAVAMLHAMFVPSQSPLVVESVVLFSDAAFAVFAIAIMWIIVTAMPNSIEITRRYRPVIDTAKELSNSFGQRAALLWTPRPAWSVAMSAVAVVALIQLYRLNDMTEFIYFNF
ncbi:MAG: MBOAT family protein [Ahrensia sp.]|nr:MBOAT family protein [Ahrensia sp.]